MSIRVTEHKCKSLEYWDYWTTLAVNRGIVLIFVSDITKGAQCIEDAENFQDTGIASSW